MLGRSLYGRMDFDKAEKEMRRAMDLGEHDPDLIIALGRTLAAKGRYQEAQNQFDSVLRVAPDNLNAVDGSRFCQARLQQALL